mmetsp:Transcript_12261/g.19456  ORF Transcript_12261/g.19456 Transcript_12261/m.19456 type:complete len:258 (+) Transcript_12261:448-1221(+)
MAKGRLRPASASQRIRSAVCAWCHMVLSILVCMLRTACSTASAFIFKRLACCGLADTAAFAASFSSSASERIVCSSKSLSTASCSLDTAWVRTFFTEDAKRSVPSVSSVSERAGEMAATIRVLLLPLKASVSRYVSLLCLKGTCCNLPTASLQMTCPRTLNELLMFWPSRIRWPAAPLFFTRSLPARSIRFSVLDRILCLAFPSLMGNVILRMKSAWLREDVLFMFVCEVARILEPKSSSAMHSSWELTGASVKCGT